MDLFNEINNERISPFVLQQMYDKHGFLPDQGATAEAASAGSGGTTAEAGGTTAEAGSEGGGGTTAETGSSASAVPEPTGMELRAGLVAVPLHERYGGDLQEIVRRPLLYGRPFKER